MKLCNEVVLWILFGSVLGGEARKLRKKRGPIPVSDLKVYEESVSTPVENGSHKGSEKDHKADKMAFLLSEEDEEADAIWRTLFGPLSMPTSSGDTPVTSVPSITPLTSGPSAAPQQFTSLPTYSRPATSVPSAPPSVVRSGSPSALPSQMTGAPSKASQQGTQKTVQPTSYPTKTPKPTVSMAPPKITGYPTTSPTVVQSGMPSRSVSASGSSVTPR